MVALTAKPNAISGERSTRKMGKSTRG